MEEKCHKKIISLHKKVEGYKKISKTTIFYSLYRFICPFSAEMETIQRNFVKLWEGEKEDGGGGGGGGFKLVGGSVTVRRSETDGEISGAGGKM